MNEEQTYKLTCKYCGNTWDWKRSDESLWDDDVTIDDAFKYDLEVLCPHCQVPSRFSEAISEEDAEALGW